MKKKLISPKYSLSGRKVVVIVLVTLMLIPLMVVPGCSSSGIEEGESAPDFTLEDLDGNQVSLGDLQGKVVFLNFWATWCPPCRAEMPDMEELHQNFKDQDVAILSINVGEEAGVVRDFVEQADYSWTFLLDEDRGVSFEYEIELLPTSFFLDTEGIIRVVKVGAMSYETMDDNLMKTIKKE